MSAPILYARSGGPPEDWFRIHVFDGDTELRNVIEADVIKGFAILREFDRKRVTLAERRIESRQLQIVRVYADRGFGT